MFQLIGPKRTRVIAQVAAGLIGAALLPGAASAELHADGEQRAADLRSS